VASAGEPVADVGLPEDRAVNARRQGGSTPRPASSEAREVRRFFQYLGLLALEIVTATGLTGLLSAALDAIADRPVDPDALARALVSTVVGGPLLAGVLLWVRRTQGAPDEVTSVARQLAIGAGALIALGVVMISAHDVLAWLLGVRRPTASAFANLVVWTAVGAAHVRVVDRRAVRAAWAPLAGAGAAAGMVVAALGLVQLVAAGPDRWWGLPRPVLLAGQHDPALAGLALFAVGGAVWWWCWRRRFRHAQRGQLWLAYVVLGGVAGGLLTTLVAGTAAAYRVVVWFAGNPGTTDPEQWFAGLPTLVATCAVGLLVWSYHRQVLVEAGGRGRAEVDRVHDHLMAGIGLVTAVVGGCFLVISLLERIAVTGDLSQARDRMLAGLVLAAAGVPVWLVSWRRCRRAVREQPDQEVHSVTRRAYLFLLLGFGSLAAVGSVLATGYVVVAAVLEQELKRGTLLHVRVPVAIGIVSALVVIGHWRTYRKERDLSARSPRMRRFVLLVGVGGPASAAVLAQRLRATVLSWARQDEDAFPATDDEVLALVEQAGCDELLVLADHGRLRAIPVRRSPGVPGGASSPDGSRRGGDVRADAT
jgi:hypothetical protein